jgi:hypothetical protein
MRQLRRIAGTFYRVRRKYLNLNSIYARLLMRISLEFNAKAVEDISGIYGTSQAGTISPVTSSKI